MNASPERMAARALQRMRHELRLRTLTVCSAERITPHCMRVTLTGDALEGFHSPGFDDHVKLFFPDATTGQLQMPDAHTDSTAPRPIMRDYTPRAWDVTTAGTRTLTIDFALHDNAGPATVWAQQAAPGQQLGVGGPRGSLLVPLAFDGYVLIGDDTALPAIARRLAELPADAPVLAVVEVAEATAQQALPTQADARIHWVHRNNAAPGDPALLAALQAQTLPTGDIHAWVACETQTAKAVRAHLIGQCGVHPKWIKASGYWRRGSAAAHDTLEDA